MFRSEHIANHRAQICDVRCEQTRRFERQRYKSDPFWSVSGSARSGEKVRALMPFNFRIVGDKVFTLDVPPESTIGEVKQQIVKYFPNFKLEFQKLIHHSRLLNDSESLKDANVAPSEYIVVQPASRRRQNRLPWASDLAAPIPGGKPPPERPPPRILPILATAPLVAPTPENVARIQPLLDMGFTRIDTETAVFRAFGNIERAADMLLSGGVEAIADPANRHSALLRRDSGTLEFVVRDVMQHLSAELREALANDPAMLLRELELDPSAFDCDSVRQRVQQAPQRDEMHERLQQYRVRADARDQIIGRLMGTAGALGREVVVAVLDQANGNEENAATILEQLLGN
jgi:hypothetical protein